MAKLAKLAAPIGSHLVADGRSRLGFWLALLDLHGGRSLVDNEGSIGSERVDFHSARLALVATCNGHQIRAHRQPWGTNKETKETLPLLLGFLFFHLLENMLCFSFLVLKEIYHYWKNIFSRGLHQMQALMKPVVRDRPQARRGYGGVRRRLPAAGSAQTTRPNAERTFKSRARNARRSRRRWRIWRGAPTEGPRLCLPCFHGLPCVCSSARNPQNVHSFRGGSKSGESWRLSWGTPMEVQSCRFFGEPKGSHRVLLRGPPKGVQA